MRFNVFLRSALGAIIAGACSLRGQVEEVQPAFREPLYFSDVDRDNRSPQAVRVGGVVFVSALSGPGDTVEAQARVAYMRLQSVLGNYGLTMADVAQERVYVKDGAPTWKLGELRPLFYGEDSGPATTLLKVAGFEEEGTLIAIELIAVANPESE